MIQYYLEKGENMLKSNTILDERDSRLRNENIEMSFPLTESRKQLFEDMITYLHDSQIEEIAEVRDLRPGMGLAAPQIGINERFFVICMEVEEDVFKEYVIINPKIISTSEELVYVEEGEGCLSVNREVEGIVPRNARITITYQDLEGNKQTLRIREEMAIAFQHEIDHLNGILFFDHIDKKDPFKNKESMRMI